MFNQEMMNEAMDSVRNLEDFDSFMQMESFVMNNQLSEEIDKLVNEATINEEYHSKPTDWNKLYNS